MMLDRQKENKLNDESTMNPKPVKKMMFRLLKPVSGYLILGFLLMLVVTALQLWLPSLIGEFIDEQILEQSGTQVAQACLFLALLALLYSGVNAIRFYLFDVAGNKIVVQLKRKLMKHLLIQDMDFFNTQKTGELTSRLSSDIEALRDILTTQLAVLLRTLAISIGGIGLLLYLSWQLTLLIVIVLPMSVLLGKLMGAKVHKNSRELQHNMATGQGFANEIFNNINLVKVFNKQVFVNQKYVDLTQNVLATSLRQGALFAWFQAASTMLTYSALILILFAGGQWVLAGKLTVGELTSFILYASMTSMSLAALLAFWAEWKRASGASERIFQLLTREPACKRPNGANMALSTFHGGIEFSGVSFSYPQRPDELALCNVSFQINPGEIVALVGASGAGKSTIAAMILGLYEPDVGLIRFDGHDYSDIEPQQLNQHMAIVEQEPKLFSGSIADNIAFGSAQPNVPMQVIQAAAKKANADDFICDFKHGYDTEVGEHGVQLSGGQKQRIAIARALLRDPKLLILDEATSALDAESEQSVQTALQALMHGRTTIIIAHRLSTILKADKIIVMKSGEIVQTGTHKELLALTGGHYASLIRAQTSSKAA